jgi:hypothetical protein
VTREEKRRLDEPGWLMLLALGLALLMAYNTLVSAP